jgi:hypothetical protein
MHDCYVSTDNSGLEEKSIRFIPDRRATINIIRIIE